MERLFQGSKRIKHIALCQGVVPIVLGGLGEGDYLKLAPPNSYLHVDQFQGPHHLAAKVQLDCFFEMLVALFSTHVTHSVGGSQMRSVFCLFVMPACPVLGLFGGGDCFDCLSFHFMQITLVNPIMMKGEILA